MWGFLYEKYEKFTLIMNDITKRSIGANGDTCKRSVLLSAIPAESQ